jgi:hypothetical protein
MLHPVLDNFLFICFDVWSVPNFLNIGIHATFTATGGLGQELDCLILLFYLPPN